MSSGLGIVLAYLYCLNYRRRDKCHKCVMLRIEILTEGKESAKKKKEEEEEEEKKKKEEEKEEKERDENEKEKKKKG